MTQLKNPKVLFEEGVPLLMDAPEMPKYSDNRLINKKRQIEYQEALSKAPTWEIKNGEEVKILLWYSSESKVWKDEFYENWQPEQGKLYDLPKVYGYKIEKCNPEECHESYCFNNSCIQPEFAILSPQVEEEESQEVPILEIKNMVHQIVMNGKWDRALIMNLSEEIADELNSNFHITRR